MPAKQKPAAVPVFTSWNEVDDALRVLRLLDARVAKAQAFATQTRAAADEKLKDVTANDLAHKARLEKDLEEFCTAQLPALAPARSRKLNHGTIEFVASKELAQMTGFTWAAILNVLLVPLQDAVTKLQEKLGKRYIRAKFELDKAAVNAAYGANQLSDAKLAELGMQMKTKDNFGYRLADNDAQPTA